MFGYGIKFIIFVSISFGERCVKMAEILYHFVFKKPKQLLWLFLKLFLIPYFMGIGILVILNLMYHTIEWINVGKISLIAAIVISILVFLITLNERAKGFDVPEDEFILYDNGWFVFWGVRANEGWIAPAKLDWVLPPAKPSKEFKKKIGYDPNWEYYLYRRYYLIQRKKGNMYKIGYKLMWTYPTEKWENWYLVEAQ